MFPFGFLYCPRCYLHDLSRRHDRLLGYHRRLSPRYFRGGPHGDIRPHLRPCHYRPQGVCVVFVSKPGHVNSCEDTKKSVVVTSILQCRVLGQCCYRCHPPSFSPPPCLCATECFPSTCNKSLPPPLSLLRSSSTDTQRAPSAYGSTSSPHSRSPRSSTRSSRVKKQWG